MYFVLLMNWIEKLDNFLFPSADVNLLLKTISNCCEKCVFDLFKEKLRKYRIKLHCDLYKNDYYVFINKKCWKVEIREMYENDQRFFRILLGEISKQYIPLDIQEIN